jgi:hypothetical protein
MNINTLLLFLILCTLIGGPSWYYGLLHTLSLFTPLFVIVAVVFIALACLVILSHWLSNWLAKKPWVQILMSDPDKECRVGYGVRGRDTLMVMRRDIQALIKVCLSGVMLYGLFKFLSLFGL